MKNFAHPAHVPTLSKIGARHPVYLYLLEKYQAGLVEQLSTAVSWMHSSITFRFLATDAVLDDIIEERLNELDPRLEWGRGFDGEYGVTVRIETSDMRAVQ